VIYDFHSFQLQLFLFSPFSVIIRVGNVGFSWNHDGTLESCICFD
jgi:hypothetical protein